MAIREFFIIHESGQLLLHHSFTFERVKNDPTLTSGLIAAIFNFAQNVEGDVIDFIRMKHVSFIFHRSKSLIYVLSMDSSTNPVHFEHVMQEIEQEFVKQYPQAHIDFFVEPEEYKPFIPILEQLLRPAENKSELLREVKWILGVEEEKLAEWPLEEIGKSCAQKLIFLQMDRIRGLYQQSPDSLVDIATDLLQRLGLSVEIESSNEEFNVTCNLCQKKRRNQCFCRAFLEEFSDQFAVAGKTLT